MHVAITKHQFFMSEFKLIKDVLLSYFLPQRTREAEVAQRQREEIIEQIFLDLRILQIIR